jgi:RHS repeat-associated protein
VGNRTASLGVSSYTNNSSNELTSTSSTTYGYDYNGNTTSKTDSTGTTSYAWDFENRLTSVTLPGSSGTVSFKYDPFGRRIEKSSSSGTSIYAYDGENLVEETNSSGAAVARYTQTQYIDEPLVMLRSGTTSYYQADGLGSLTSLSNASGALTNTYAYDSFGNLVASSGSIVNNIRYTGREFDTETNLYYYRARYYDPQDGRFLSEDPIAFRGGGNFYPYALGQPLKYTDPRGQIPLPLITAGIGAVAGGLGDLGGQVIGNIRNGRPISNIDMKEVIVATGTGAVAGALAPIAATTWAGAAILGGLSSAAQMLVLNHWENRCTTSSGLAFAFGLGALGGLAGGPTSTGNAFSTSSPYLDRSIAIQSNQAIQNSAARSNFTRSLAGGLVSNLPPKNSTDCGCQ